MELDSLQHAIGLRDTGELDAALREFEALAALSSTSRDKSLIIGNQVNCLLRLGRIKEARERWMEADRLDPGPSLIYLDAWLCVEEGRREEAVRSYNLFLKYPIEANSDFSKSIDQESYLDATERLGKVLLDQARYAEATPVFEDALKLAEGDQHKRLCGQLGSCYVAVKNWSAAEEMLMESLSADDQGPWWMQAQYYLGVCHLETGKLQLAERELIRSMPADRQDPSWATAQYQLGRVYFKRGAYLKAKQAFEMSEMFETQAEQRKHISEWVAVVCAKLGVR